MSVRTLKWAVEVLAGPGGFVERCALAGCDEKQWFGAVVDTRKECSGRIFFAFEGESADGHMFTEEAIDRGCIAVVLEKDEFARKLERSGAPMILVKDTLTALQNLARAYRNTLNISIVAITGSSGKTTTKEFTRSILKQKYRVHGNPESYNSQVGVPLTILETGEDTEYLVSEVGANQAGEIDFLGAMLKPDIGVITNIGDAHIGLFGNRERIAYAKAELLCHLGTSGYAILPGDSDFLVVLVKHAKCRHFTFGFSDNCGYRITDVRSSHDRIEFAFNGAPASIKVAGKHNLENAAAAMAVGDLCGIEFNRTCKGLLETELLTGRGKVHKIGGVIVVDDSYNANPNSMRASLDTLMEFEGDRKIAVLGEMKELGEHSRDCHRNLGEYIAGLGVEQIYWVGESGGYIEDGYRLKEGKGRISICADVEELVRQLMKELRTGDTVLVKGSRACKLERVVEAVLVTWKSGEEN